MLEDFASVSLPGYNDEEQQVRAHTSPYKFRPNPEDLHPLRTPERASVVVILTTITKQDEYKVVKLDSMRLGVNAKESITR
ncbi:hypothetical protein PanWU01x14_118810 [Parasponia andersonii]|uniref:Uncharacterized protein n=1 Tax=Parasponia andersonii TaxID=3476 RepID=A0A2P5CVW5_PARAD|nr:hypothetical protein PanWU01x14_118810 [Parasponia andersonii]